MKKLKFNREMYSKVALIKAAYNFTDIAFIHLDADKAYYYVSLKTKNGAKDVSEEEFINEMLTQSVRHEIYQQTKNIRELIMARAMASSVVADTPETDEDGQNETFFEDDILKDWFVQNENQTI